MAADTLTLGSVTFELDDLPETIPLGGEQMLVVTKFPGGYKDIQVFGAFDDNIALSGVFNYTNAKSKTATLEQMYKSGGTYLFKIGSLKMLTVIIKNFKYTYQSLYNIAYSIELEVVPSNSTAVGWGGVPTSSGSTPTSQPASNAPAPQRVYVVVKGDCLWKIAKRYYGSGTQYMKIATANKIKNPRLIYPGQQLVIP